MMPTNTTCYIGLGSNLKQPVKQLELATKAIHALPSTEVTAQSHLYRSKAVGPGEQPDYVNGVIAINTGLLPEALLDELQQIEFNQGRTREIKWGPRTLDLDILLYGDEHVETERLTIPHPYLEQRNFVVYPLADIASPMTLPSGATIEQLKQQLTMEGLWQM